MHGALNGSKNELAGKPDGDVDAAIQRCGLVKLQPVIGGSGVKLQTLMKDARGGFIR
jgi:hypothetical protein